MNLTDQLIREIRLIRVIRVQKIINYLLPFVLGGRG